jgi:hypothetical protein
MQTEDSLNLLVAREEDNDGDQSSEIENLLEPLDLGEEKFKQESNSEEIPLVSRKKKSRVRTPLSSVVMVLLMGLAYTATLQLNKSILSTI